MNKDPLETLWEVICSKPFVWVAALWFMGMLTLFVILKALGIPV